MTDLTGHVPDFLCIGAQKAGTTWLGANLRDHPDIWIPPFKELHYFDAVHMPHIRDGTHRFRTTKSATALRKYFHDTPDEAWNYDHLSGLAHIMKGDLTDDWYRRIFRLAKPHQVCGDLTPEYSVMPEAGVDHVLRLLPRIKAILVLRDPIERNWSSARMVAQKRGATAPEQLARIARSAAVTMRGDYPAMLRRWRARLQPEQLLVVTFDQITEEPAALLAQVCTFLGVSFDASFFSELAKPVFAGKPMVLPPAILEYFKRSTRPIYEALADEFPELTRKWLARY